MKDGKVEPKEAPIRRDGNVYFLTNDIEITTSYIRIEAHKDDIWIDGNEYVLKGREIILGYFYHTEKA